MSALDLAGRLALAKYLTEQIAEIRSDELLPESQDQIPSGARLPVMIGGSLVAWVNMPEPTQRSAYVKDERALLAWAEIHHPAKVADVETVTVTPEVLAVLREHLPGAITTKRQADPQWVSDIGAGLRKNGCYQTAQGEKLTEVPGITVPEPELPVPHVALEGKKGAAFTAALAAIGALPDDLLALPSGDGGETP